MVANDQNSDFYAINIIFKQSFKKFGLKNTDFAGIAALVLLCMFPLRAQDIGLFEQHNGRYDFVFMGNTMNVSENNLLGPCVTLTESSADLTLADTDVLLKAYLYWAGSGTGDLDVTLNGQAVSAQRSFPLEHWATGFDYFSAFADVTDIVSSYGNGTYTLSDLDVSSFLVPGTTYCQNATNFSGWALVVLYENASLPLNQINIYDGLQGVPLEITIMLDNLNVIDNEGAKIGFVAWEGDSMLAINETLRINGTILAAPPLNPSTNAFNSTNSFTGATNLYNMDLDVYNIQNNITIGDTQAQIQLTSGQYNSLGQLQGDFVLISTVVTKLNSQLPDATIVAETPEVSCNSNVVRVVFTVSNVNSTDELPPGVPIALYANDVFVAYTETLLPLAIGESVQDEITFVLPDGVSDPVSLKLVVDDMGTGLGIVTELNEQNNTFTMAFERLPMPEFQNIPALYTCNLALGRGVFDLSELPDQILAHENQTIAFYTTLDDAEQQLNPIADLHAFQAMTPATLYVRIQEVCHAISLVELRTRNCPPTVYNYVSVNNDGFNDAFVVEGLRDIFVNFKMFIYNRWGALVWTGSNDTPDWDGRANHGLLHNNGKLPDGTYYYVLELHDPDYPEPLTGFVYLNH